MRRAATLALTVIVIAACGDRPQVHVLQGRTMGSDWSVKIVGVLPQTKAALHEGVQARFEQVDGQMSTFRDVSDLSRFNRSAAGEWQELPSELLIVMRRALDLAAQTGGVYDPTVGPLVNLWGFGPDGSIRAPPDAQRIEQARARVGWQRVQVDVLRGSARHEAGVQVDLSSLAKGFGVDQVADYLDAAGIDSYLIDLSGKIKARGRNAAGLPWQVAVEQPGPDDQASGAGALTDTVIALSRRAVASAGDYRHFFASSGRRYSHIIDPRSGAPVTHALAGVTLISGSCLDADALVTALLVLGPDAGYAFARQHQLAALFIERRGGGYDQRTTPQFAPFIAPL